MASESVTYSNRRAFLLLPVRIAVGLAKAMVFVIAFFCVGFPVTLVVLFTVLAPSEIAAVLLAVASWPAGIFYPPAGKWLLTPPVNA